MSSNVRVKIVGEETVSGAAKRAETGLDGLRKGANNLVKQFGAATLIGAGVVGTLKQVAQFAGECVEAFAENEKATLAFNRALEVNESVGTRAGSGLRTFADSVALMTGETGAAVLSMETLLITSGRTEDQVRKIISAAVDMSAATGKDLRSAIEQLNKTFGGTGGELMEIIPELKELTKEEFQNGEAVDILAEKYRGMGSALEESSTVSINNFKNALSDLKASIGGLAEELFKPLRDGLTQAIQSATTQINQMAAEQRVTRALSSGDISSITDSDVAMALTRTNERLVALQKNIDSPLNFPFRPFMLSEKSMLQNLQKVLAQITRDRAMNDQGRAYLATGGAGLVGPPATPPPPHPAPQEDEDDEDGEKKPPIDPNAHYSTRPGQGQDSDEFISNLINGIMYPEGGGERVSTMDQILELFKGLVTPLASVQALLDPIGTILAGTMDILGPLIDTILAPLVGGLRILGQTVGLMLAPLFSALGPVVRYVAEIFVWLYNKVLRPFGNGIITIFNLIHNAVVAVINFFAWILGMQKHSYRSLDEGHLEEISLDTLSQTGSAVVGGTTGASASYTTPRDIVVNVDVTTAALVGEDGIRQFALIIGRELKSAGVLGVA